jgi:N-acetylneuraminic acid mutarotase
MLTLADRVAYQRAIEEVYWRHRIWPKERPDPKPSLDAVMPSAQLEKKVEDYLLNSQALEDYWQKPISAEQLQAEMERMAQHTKQPEVLHELFAALGNDPFVIGECLARQALSERLVTNFYSHDQRFHGELRQRAEAELLAHHSVEQMKQTSGNYCEIELVRSDSGREEENRDAEPRLRLNSYEWDKKVEKLAAMFGGVRAGGARLPAVTTQIKTGVLSSLQEDEERYYATALLYKSKDRLKLATVEWRKEPLESWRAGAEQQMSKVMAAATANYAVPTISPDVNGCTDDTWTATAAPPEVRSGHTAVWTGSEMIIWGGALYPTSFNTGGRYNPSTDTWTTTSTTNAPTARSGHTAVWTGSEMIIWGGTDASFNTFNTGGRYNPSTDTWTSTSTTNAPSGRVAHTAVWAGNEMIIWGGNGPAGYLNTGGRYNPNTDSWIATSTSNAPDGRYDPTAVWTGSEMIVWGGTNDTTEFNTGGRYNPSTDSWIATSVTNAPEARETHTAVWTGNEMIVWGGSNYSDGRLNTGGRYNPTTDSWIATSTTNAPSPRDSHTAVWTGSIMIVWGGENGGGPPSPFNDGGKYNPGTNSWTATGTANAPDGRFFHTAVWTGSEMIVWGGYTAGNAVNTGGRYNPNADSWVATTTYNTPTARGGQTALWTGSEMIVWGGTFYDDGSHYLNTGGRYNPTTDSWTVTSTVNAPTGRYSHTAVWTGSEMVIWGGYFLDFSGEHFLNTGARYNPSTDSWATTSTANAPAGRYLHTSVWTGSEMIVWGGFGSSGDLSTGGRYNPGTNGWIATTSTNAPVGRDSHTAVWTGSEMIAWGGYDGSQYLNTGARYNPGTDSWTATSTINAPDARALHTAIWTGNKMVVWGGLSYPIYFSTGGSYNPIADSWTATSTTSAPSARDSHTALWTGGEMIIWGGFTGAKYGDLNTGGRYSPGTDSWIATTSANAPVPRDSHTAVWTGSEMIVWGGNGSGGVFNTGGRYCAQSAPMAQSAVSRKTHGGAGTFDIPLPLTGNVGIECRSGGSTNDYQMIINFMTTVTVGSASVTSGTGSVSSFSVSGSQVTVNLTGVTNVQRITVTLFNVNDGTHMGNVPVFMGVLVGDVNGNGAVSAADVALTKSQVGVPVSGSNFLEDVNANGVVNSVDVALVKARVGTALPPY